MYLKKGITMRDDGILIQPNAMYVFFLTHFFLQRVSLKGRFRGHSQRKPKAKKGSPHRKSKVGLAMGPASDLELLKLLGVGPRAAPREEGPLRL